MTTTRWLHTARGLLAWVALLGIALVSVLLLPQHATRADGRDREPFRPRKVIPPQRPITEAPIAGAAEMNRKLADSEIVLGVEIDGKARAYPINMLTGPSREIINDTLGGRKIAATW